MIKRTEFLRLFRKHVRRAARIYDKTYVRQTMRRSLLAYGMRCPFLNFDSFPYERKKEGEDFERAADHFGRYYASIRLYTQMLLIVIEETNPHNRGR